MKRTNHLKPVRLDERALRSLVREIIRESRENPAQGGTSDPYLMGLGEAKSAMEEVNRTLRERGLSEEFVYESESDEWKLSSDPSLFVQFTCSPRGNCNLSPEREGSSPSDTQPFGPSLSWTPRNPSPHALRWIKELALWVSSRAS